MIRGSILLLVVMVVTALLYTILPGRTPIHFNQDELGFSLNAYSLAKTGFDDNGRFLPLYFWHLGVMWATPIIVYLTSLVLLFLPLSEMTVRLPSVLIGLVDVLLMYFLARRLFGDRWGLAAAGLLALTPVHFIQSRILLDNLYIVPFVMGWLLLLFAFVDRRAPWLLLAVGLVLGFGIHSYHAAKVMMPLYLLMTIFFLLPEIKKHKRLVLLLVAGFVLPLVPLIGWLTIYPDTFIDQVKYTQLYDTKLGPFAGVLTLLTPSSIVHRLDVLVNYFNPYFLFVRGDASLIHSTWRSGVFLFASAVFIPLGLWAIVNKRDRFSLLVIAGFLTAPISGALVGDHYRISRVLVILPFAILLATAGIRFLSSRKHLLVRGLCAVLVLSLPLQFLYFLFDYFTGYRIRSYAWMKYDIPGALETTIRETTSQPTDTIYLDSRIEFVDRYWRFYLIKNNKFNLESKTEFIDVRNTDLGKLKGNSVLLANFNDVDGQKEQIGPFQKKANVFEPDGISTFYIYRN